MHITTTLLYSNQTRHGDQGMLKKSLLEIVKAHIVLTAQVYHGLQEQERINHKSVICKGLSPLCLIYAKQNEYL